MICVLQVEQEFLKLQIAPLNPNKPHPRLKSIVSDKTLSTRKYRNNSQKNYQYG